MRAWLFKKPEEPMKIVELPDPVPGENQVALDVKAAGLCHSDVGILEGPGMAWLHHTPIVLGHEVAGVITKVGAGVRNFRVGDRVALNPMFGVGEDPTKGFAPGTGRDGGYAEKTLAYPEELVRIPDNVSFEKAAPVTDAGMTSYHAIFAVGGVKKGTRLGIIGLGGLGMMGARAAVIAGAEVYGVDVKHEVFPVAKELGVKECFTKVSDLAKLNLNVIVDFAGMGTTTADAVNAVGFHGRVVLVGLGAMESTISTFTLAIRRIELLGSCGGTSQDMIELYKLVESGQLDIGVTPITFDEIGEGLHRLQRGEVNGRLVARIGS